MFKRIAALLLCLSALVAARAGETVTENLRGFGAVKADFSLGADGSVLGLEAATPAAAKLWQAKFLADLSATTGGAKEEKVGDCYAWRLPGGGLFVAATAGKRTAIIYGKDAAALAAAAKGAKVQPTAQNTRASVTPPMYLDGYSQHAFRFYYWPGQTPPGTPGDRYDPLGEFEFLKKVGGLGLVFWMGSHNADLAAGVTNEHTWNWAYRQMQKRHLPAVMNISFGDPTPVANAFRDETVVGMPHYAGNFHSVGDTYLGRVGCISWASENARRAQLQDLQHFVRKYHDADNVIEFLEPHGELNHGNYTVFLEYGPLVDESFRAFLKERYQTPAAVAKRYGDAAIKGWQDVRLPEIAEFFGWGKDAIDLAGDWRLGYLPLKPGQEGHFQGGNFDQRVEAASEKDEYYAEKCDDSQWPLIQSMPGSDYQLFLKKQPVVARRHFKLEKKPSGKMHLYLWDLNQGNGENVKIYLNGQQVCDDPIRHNTPHWVQVEVSSALRAGDNVIALRLPKGFIGYRVYLTPAAPRAYPFLGREMNARWVDFSDWQGWSRDRAVRQGIAAIREIEPDRTIISMAPGHYANQLLEDARKYGMRFHDTGIMSVILAEYLPMLMRGADLPFSLEPGAPASDLTDFKLQTGLYMVSGLDAIHYFIHVGSVMWRDDLRQYFEKIAPALKQLGRQYQPKSDVAVLFDSDQDALEGYPWIADNNASYPCGYWNWRFNETLMRDYPTDGLTPQSFHNGAAAKYRVIIDANNTIMRQETIAGIERWVKDGGVFVAMMQSGRHSPEEPDSWPSRALTGYKATVFSRYDHRGDPAAREESHTVDAAQPVFNGMNFRWQGDGVKFEAEDPAAMSLATWADGKTAIGLRPLGKGWVVTCGSRLAYYDHSTRVLLGALLKWAKATPLPLRAEAPLIPRHYVSTNGLHDVWVLWNSDRQRAVDYKFDFVDGQPRQLTDVLTGEEAPAAGQLPPLEFRVVRSPRPDPAVAARKWFQVQCNHWRGVEKPPVSVSDRVFTYRDYALPLDGEWDFRELAADEDAASALAKTHGWGKRETGIWLKDDEVKGDRFLIRRRFTVPAGWNKGKIRYWFTAMYLHGTANGQLKFYCNGKQVAVPPPHHGVANLDLGLKAGEEAEIAIEINNATVRVRGTDGASFLAYIPDPDQVIDLAAGQWQAYHGVASTTPQAVKIPGDVVGNVLRTSFDLPALKPGQRAYLYLEGNDHYIGAIVNGRFLRRHHHMVGRLTYMDVTPFLKPGAKNDLAITAWDENPEQAGDVKEVKLFIYDRPLSQVQMKTAKT
ncbi:MAG: hypothetical protein J6333_03170 [Planctomycetes bacterium]|nr:hypothetical protein [Planctomycetota bacterium]